MDSRITLPRSAGKRLETLSVIRPSLSLYRRPSSRSPKETELTHGQRFHVYDYKGHWAWGQAVSPMKASSYKGYIGYVLRKGLGKTGAATHCVEVLKAPLFASADIKSPVKRVLPLNSCVRKQKENDDFIALDDGGYLHKRHIRMCKDQPSETDFVTIAEHHLGLPYIWGGVTTLGLDCSGLVLSSLRAVGQDAPRDADQQEAALGTCLPIKLSGLKRGDLVFWKGHVGIMQSATQMIHANAYHMGVVSEPVKGAVKRIADVAGPVTSIKRL